MVLALAVVGAGCRWTPPAGTSIDTLKLAEDQYRNSWDIFIKIGAAIGGIVVFAVGVWQFSRTQKDTFRLKAIELALQGESAYAAKERAKFIQAFFADTLPTDFLHDVDTKKFGFGTAAKRRKEFIALVAANPTQRHQIMLDWADLFPDDVWKNEDTQSYTLQWLGRLMQDEQLTVPAPPPV
jgi:hypothetical protein